MCVHISGTHCCHMTHTVLHCCHMTLITLTWHIVVMWQTYVTHWTHCCHVTDICHSLDTLLSSDIHITLHHHMIDTHLTLTWPFLSHDIWHICATWHLFELMCTSQSRQYPHPTLTPPSNPIRPSSPTFTRSCLNVWCILHALKTGRTLGLTFGLSSVWRCVYTCAI